MISGIDENVHRISRSTRCLTQNGNFLTLALGISLFASKGLLYSGENQSIILQGLKPVWKGSHARYDQEVSLVARPMNIV